MVRMADSLIAGNTSYLIAVLLAIRQRGKYSITPDSSVTLHFDPLTETDADALVELGRTFHLEDGHPLGAVGEAALRQIARGEPLARAWLIRQRDQTLGYVIITLGFSVEYGGRDGFIDDLYLIRAARGRGLGREVLEFAVTRAAELGIGTLHLEVETDNEHATRLYRAAGFKETGRRLMRLSLRRE
jgi:ribosomal protein S18 acetylase RimI-like enzyme